MPDEVTDQTPPEDSWSGPSQDEWQEMMELKDMISQALNQPAPQSEQPVQQNQPQYNLNPWENPDNFSNDLGSFIKDQIQEAVAPYSAHTEDQIMSEAEERAYDIIDSLASERGDLPSAQARDLVRSLADNYIVDAQQQYGFGPQAAEAALSQAFDDVKSMFEESNKNYYDSRMNELATLGNAPREAPASTPSAQGPERVKGDEMALVRSIFQR